MKTAKISFTVPQELLDEVRALIGDGNLSAYITQGLERQIRADRLAQFLSELDQEFEPLTEEEVEAVRREWHNAV